VASLTQLIAIGEIDSQMIAGKYQGWDKEIVPVIWPSISLIGSMGFQDRWNIAD
jgi:hypothetical protein